MYQQTKNVQLWEKIDYHHSKSLSCNAPAEVEQGNALNLNFSMFSACICLYIWWHDNRFEVNWHPKPTLVLRWISKFFLFGALPSDKLKIKHTKKLKEIPSGDALENLPEKASMYAFVHLKLIGNLQGFCQYIMADMLNFTIANYRKYSVVVFLGS